MTQVLLAPIFSRPQVFKSDSTCKIGGKRYDSILLLVDHRGMVIWPACSWLRELRIGRGAPLTASQYARSLSLLWWFLQRQVYQGHRGWPWDQVDDSVLLRWRTELEARKGRHGDDVEEGTVNSHLLAVLLFYRWAQEHQFCFDRIGVTRDGYAPYPIRLVWRRHRKGRSLSSDLLLRVGRKSRRPIPTRTEVESLYVHLGGESPVNIRDCLMCRWAVGSGLRASEILSLKKGHIPSRSKCEKAQRDGKVLWISVTGKNRSTRDVPVLPEVLIETHDFIDFARAEILSNVGDHSAQELFVSVSTGKKLSREVFSRTVSSAFRRIGSRELTLHRLRARFASLLVRELRKEEEDKSGLAGYRELTVLERAAEILGHSDLGSLRFYLNLDLDKEDAAARAAMTLSLASIPDQDLDTSLYGDLSLTAAT